MNIEQKQIFEVRVNEDAIHKLAGAFVGFLGSLRIETQRTTVDSIQNQPNEDSSDGYSLEIKSAPNYTQKWPGPNDYEPLTNVQEGTARYNGHSFTVKLGFAIRNAAGKERVRIVILVNGYPAAEFAGADAVIGGTSLVASVIKVNGKHVPAKSEVPPTYAGMPIGSYREIVDGPNASYGMAVICAQNDYPTMVKHALIRYTTSKTQA